MRIDKYTLRIIFAAVFVLTAAACAENDGPAEDPGTTSVAVRAAVSERPVSGTRAGREKEGWTVADGQFAFIYPDVSNTGYAAGICSFSDINGGQGRTYPAQRGAGNILVSEPGALLPKAFRNSEESAMFYMDNVMSLEPEGTEIPGVILFDDALQKRFSAGPEDMSHRPGMAGDDGSTNDLIWGTCTVPTSKHNEQDFYGELTFNLYHRMSRLSVVIIDEYNREGDRAQENYGESPMTIWLENVVHTPAQFDRSTGRVSVAEGAESEGPLYITSETGESLKYDVDFTSEEQNKMTAADINNVEVRCYVTQNVIVPPQTFSEPPRLRIRYKDKTYSGTLPRIILSTDDDGNKIQLNMQFEQGKHLLIRVRFTPSYNDELKFDVSLVDWYMYGKSENWAISGTRAGIYSPEMWKELVEAYNRYADADAMSEGPNKQNMLDEIKEKLRRYGDIGSDGIWRFQLITHITTEDLQGEGMRFLRTLYKKHPFLFDFGLGWMICDARYEYDAGKWNMFTITTDETGKEHENRIPLDIDTNADELPQQLLEKILTN